LSRDLRLERHGAVLVATIDRPAHMNALGVGLKEELAAAWSELKMDRSVRAIVITAAGDRAFCSGRDLKETVASGEFGQEAALFSEALRLTPLSCGIWTPTIVAVNGVCAAAGLHFVADADVVIASESAWFVDTHVSVGQVTALEPISLAHRIGLGNTLRLAVLGRKGRLDATEALRISLVDEVVGAERLQERAMELAQAAATGSPAAIEASKRAIRGSVELPLAEAMQRGWEILLAHRDHPDALEGPRAFVERRVADWRRIDIDQ